jgi:hypothetical protein
VFIIHNRACKKCAFKIFFSCSLSAPLIKARSRAEKDVRPLSHLVFRLSEAYPVVVLSRPLHTCRLLDRVLVGQLVVCLKAPWCSLLRWRFAKEAFKLVKLSHLLIVAEELAVRSLRTECGLVGFPFLPKICLEFFLVGRREAVAVNTVGVAEERLVHGVHFRVLPASALPSGRNQMHLRNLGDLAGLGLHDNGAQLLVGFLPFPGLRG